MARIKETSLGEVFLVSTSARVEIVDLIPPETRAVLMRRSFRDAAVGVGVRRSRYRGGDAWFCEFSGELPPSLDQLLRNLLRGRIDGLAVAFCVPVLDR